MSSSVGTTFLGALQASISVLLTIAYGLIAAQFQLLDAESGKKVSTLCVKLFLPALLITNLGEQLDIESGSRYVPILVWSLIYNGLSMILGYALVKFFKMPAWTTPAVTFNNSIAMPVLLTQALQQTGVLDSILWGSDDSTSAAVARAKSYFLFNAMITDSLTFGLGPRLLGGHSSDDAPNKSENSDDEGSDEEEDSESQTHANGHSNDEEEIRANEATSLLPDRAVRAGTQRQQKARRISKKYWAKLPNWAQTTLEFAFDFISAPLVGALIGVIIGLVPPLKRAFFNNTFEGGFMNAWLTNSVSNIGELFTALQIVVVGVKLSQSLMAMKKGEESGHVPWIPFIAVAVIRFIIWPAISISAIYLLATRTSVLGSDPILWFAMMLMPTGPPALKLTALADVSGAGEEEKMSIAKFLTLSYMISPLLSFTVVGAHKASTAALG